MKTKDKEEGRKLSFLWKNTPIRISIILFFISGLLLNSCYVTPWYGEDGRQGNAYVALTWVDAKPDYIDAGPSGIPPVFYWDQYYRAVPGYYSLYYEGSVWNGYGKSFYAWEIYYEIWRMEGENGGLYYHGADGADTYFTLECSPYGPYIYEDLYKDQPAGFELIQNSEDEVTIEKTDGAFRLRATYKKVEPGNHQK